MTALLLSFSLPKPLRYAAFGSLIVVLIVVLLGYLIIRKQLRFLSGTFTWLGNRITGRAWIEAAGARAQTLEDRVYGFYDRNRDRFLVILALEICFHLAGIAEGDVKRALNAALLIEISGAWPDHQDANHVCVFNPYPSGPAT